MSKNTVQTAPLMPIDYIFIGVNPFQVEFVFYYNYPINFERFKTALDATLPDFYLVSSMLQPVADDRYQLVSCSEGLEFETVTDSGSEMDTENRYAYLNSVKTREGEPLTKIRLTHVGGGTVMTISVSHIVADGFSCFYFLSELAKAYHGHSVTRPNYNRDWYVNNPMHLDARPTNMEMLEATGFPLKTRRYEIPTERIVWENRFIAQEEIDSLLAEASKTTDSRLSKNDVITAFLWKTYVSKWHPAALQGSPNFTMPFDARRFSDWVSGQYFGNGICLASGALTGERFLEASLGELALLVRQTVNKVDRAYVQKSYDVFETFRCQYGREALQDFHVADPESGILVTNLSRVPLEGLDFGQGKPFRFFTATPSPGAAIVLPAENGLKVDICYPFDCCANG